MNDEMAPIVVREKVRARGQGPDDPEDAFIDEIAVVFVTQGSRDKSVRIVAVPDGGKSRVEGWKARVWSHPLVSQSGTIVSATTTPSRRSERHDRRCTTTPLVNQRSVIVGSQGLWEG